MFSVAVEQGFATKTDDVLSFFSLRFLFCTTLSFFFNSPVPNSFHKIFFLQIPKNHQTHQLPSTHIQYQVTNHPQHHPRHHHPDHQQWQLLPWLSPWEQPPPHGLWFFKSLKQVVPNSIPNIWNPKIGGF